MAKSISKEEWLKLQKPKRNKFGAKKTVIDGKSFPSRLEADVYRLQILRQNAGEIRDLKWYSTVKLTDAEISYKADAEAIYTKTGEPFWIEAKGKETERYRVIKRLWEHYGPGPLEVYKAGRSQIYLAEIITPKKPITIQEVSGVGRVITR